MAREKMVTRTIRLTVAEVLAVDIPRAEAMVREYTLPGVYKDDVQLLHKLQEVYGSEDLVIVAVRGYNHIEKLYGMTEAEFLKHAVELEDRFQRI